MITEHRALRVRRRLAAAAPPVRAESSDERYGRNALDANVEQMAWDWAWWAVTRKYYGRPQQPSSVLAQFGKENIRATDPARGPNAAASAVLARYHQAVISGDDLQRAAFEGYFLWRVKPIKKLAHLLGVNRGQVYRLRNKFARRCYLLATK